jgi:hypothetical protein
MERVAVPPAVTPMTGAKELGRSHITSMRSAVSSSSTRDGQLSGKLEHGSAPQERSSDKPPPILDEDKRKEGN